MNTPMIEHFDAFTCSCLANHWEAGNDPDKVAQLWASAESKEAFIKALQEDPNLRYCQACGLLSRGDFYFIRSMIGDLQFKTVADAGSVCVFSGNFSILIPTGGGDGVARCAVISKNDKFNTEVLDYVTLLEGDFLVSRYDCNTDPQVHLSGRYQVYHGNGFVIFREIE
jgi:hypothetical protein